MEKNFKLKLTEEMVKDVQTLGAEVDARVYVIDSMFDTHKTDTDNSIFASVPFNMYQRELVLYKQKYDQAVKELGDKYIIPMVREHLGVDNVDFDWRIDDFTTLEVDITLK